MRLIGKFEGINEEDYEAHFRWNPYFKNLNCSSSVCWSDRAIKICLVKCSLVLQCNKYCTSYVDVVISLILKCFVYFCIESGNVSKIAFYQLRRSVPTLDIATSGDVVFYLNDKISGQN